MTPAKSSNPRHHIEIDLSDRSLVIYVGDRPVHAYWLLLAPQVRHLLLAPERRFDGARLGFSWTPLEPERPIAPAELVTIRTRLDEVTTYLLELGLPAGSGPTELQATWRDVAGAFATWSRTLLQLSDDALAGFVARTPHGLALHSWGAWKPGIRTEGAGRDSLPHEPGASAAAGARRRRSAWISRGLITLAILLLVAGLATIVLRRTTLPAVARLPDKTAAKAAAVPPTHTDVAAGQSRSRRTQPATPVPPGRSTDAQVIAPATGLPPLPTSGRSPWDETFASRVGVAAPGAGAGVSTASGASGSGSAGQSGGSLGAGMGSGAAPAGFDGGGGPAASTGASAGPNSTSASSPSAARAAQPSESAPASAPSVIAAPDEPSATERSLVSGEFEPDRPADAAQLSPENGKISNDATAELNERTADEPSKVTDPRTNREPSPVAAETAPETTRNSPQDARTGTQVPPAGHSEAPIVDHTTAANSEESRESTTPLAGETWRVLWSGSKQALLRDEILPTQPRPRGTASQIPALIEAARSKELDRGSDEPEEPALMLGLRMRLRSGELHVEHRSNGLHHLAVEAGEIDVGWLITASVASELSLVTANGDNIAGIARTTDGQLLLTAQSPQLQWTAWIAASVRSGEQEARWEQPIPADPQISFDRWHDSGRAWVRAFLDPQQLLETRRYPLALVAPHSGSRIAGSLEIRPERPLESPSLNRSAR